MTTLSGNNWELHVGDCRDVLPELNEKPRLIFADPPFNIGQYYNGYSDSVPWRQYVTFSRQWIEASFEVLSPDGLLCVHVPDNVVSVVLKVVPLQASQVAWIIWHYRFGQCGRNNWINSKAHCLVFAKNLPHTITWNPDAILVDSDRKSKYGDKRIDETENGGSRVPFDVWGIPSDGPYWGRVQGNNAERREGHPNQLPEVYLERIIRAYTNPGDLVCDPFVGSGTTPTVAVALGRRFVGCEISEESARSAASRIENGAVRID